MTMCVTVSHNLQYCDEHNLIRVMQDSCQCVDFPEMTDCYVCEGTKVISWKELPFEINIADGNFHMLWNSLGLDPKGKPIDGRILLDALKIYDPDLGIRATEEDGNFIHCGTTPAQIARYMETLTEIANEAIRREQPVIWY